MESTTTHSQISIRITDDLYARVKERAEREERSVSQTIRHALRRYVEQPS